MPLLDLDYGPPDDQVQIKLGDVLADLDVWWSWIWDEDIELDRVYVVRLHLFDEDGNFKRELKLKPRQRAAVDRLLWKDHEEEIKRAVLKQWVGRE